MLGLLCFMQLVMFCNYSEPGGPQASILVSAVGSKIYAASINPAILKTLNSSQVAASYARPYNLLAYTSILANYSSWGLSLATLGIDNYQEAELKLGTGFAIGHGLFYGLSLANKLLITNTRKRLAWPALNLGLLLDTQGRPEPKLPLRQLAVVIENLNYPWGHTDEEAWPVTLRLAGLFMPQKNLSLACEVKRTQNIAELSFGSEFLIGTHWALRLGYHTNPTLYGCGLGLNFNRLEFDYGLRYHPRLKETSILSLSVRL
ncbi:MAG: hypothetical protein ABIK10_01725 [candidate division WOR-3 bacterium]